MILTGQRFISTVPLPAHVEGIRLPERRQIETGRMHRQDIAAQRLTAQSRQQRDDPCAGKNKGGRR